MTATLTAAAIRAVPPEAGFRVETTTVDGHGHALLACAVCSWYGYHVSSRIGGGIRLTDGSRLFRRANMSQLTDAAAAHTCPPEVLNAHARAQHLAVRPEARP